MGNPYRCSSLHCSTSVVRSYDVPVRNFPVATPPLVFRSPLKQHAPSLLLQRSPPLGFGFSSARLPVIRRSKQSLQEPEEENEQVFAKSNSEFFVKWNVPWDGQTVIVTMASFGTGFLFTGLGVSLLFARLGFRQRQLDFDEQSLLVFINQLLETVTGITVVNTCIKNYKPFPPELFYYDWKNPFNLQRGWLLWSLVGIISGTAAVLLAGTIVTFINGEPLPREGQDALLQLLPLIGASGTSTALLLSITGILAPFLEETVFRGFLMVSLTKWMPIPAAVVVSSGAFALAHFTPGEIPQLFALGIVLGFSYAKSGNLLTPMIVHGMWNSGVLLLLTLLRLQGYDIQELI